MTRLTWLANEPAPYESGWSIFTKILYWNVLTPHKLRRLIDIDEPPKHGARPLHTIRSDWIDFALLAAFLGIEAQRLRQGFLSELMGQQRWNLCIEQQGVRHCPECLALGYHSVIFDVALLDTCPWHEGVALTPPCYYCLHYRGGSDPAQRCAHIETLVAASLLRAKSPSYSGNPWRPIRAQCEQWVQWWASVTNAFPVNTEGQHELLGIESAHQSRRVMAHWLRYVETLVGSACPLQLALPHASIDILQWRYRPVADGQSPLDDLSVQASYKSLRRHVRKRFGCHHQTCIRRLGRTGNGCTNCPVAIVYDAWRRANERWTRQAPDYHDRTLRLRSFSDFRCEQRRSDLYQLYASFVQALDAVSSMDPTAIYALTAGPGESVIALAHWRSPLPDPVATLLLPDQARLQMRLAGLRCPSSAGYTCDSQQWRRCCTWFSSTIALAAFGSGSRGREIKL